MSLEGAVKMKKLLPILLALLLLGGLMLAGCGEDEETVTTAAPTETTAAPTETTAEPTETTAASTETTAPADSGETYQLRWAQYSSAALESSKPQIEMAENIAERTNGRCKVEIFWSDSLVGIWESMDAVRLGSAEMATFPFGPHAGVDARFKSSEMPLYYNTMEAQVDALTALAPFYSAMFEEKFNQKCVQVTPMGSLESGSNKTPLQVMADWKGLLTSTISPLTDQVVAKLGGVGAPASPLDVYELLQRSTVDATVQSLGKYYEAQLWEVCDYLTVCMFCSSSRATTINTDVWNKMPKDIQDIVLEEAELAQDKVTEVTLQQYYEQLKVIQENMTVHFLPAAERDLWRAEIQPIVDGLISDMGDFGQEVVRTAEEANAKYPYPY